MSSTRKAPGYRRAAKTSDSRHRKADDFGILENNRHPAEHRDGGAASSHQSSSADHQARPWNHTDQRRRNFRGRYVKKFENSKFREEDSAAGIDFHSTGDDGLGEDGEIDGGSRAKLDGDGGDELEFDGGRGSKLNHDDAHIDEIDVSSAESGKGREKEAETGIDEDDMVKRLEELRVHVQEGDLSEELSNNNKQMQEDELLALESIYGEKIVILENRSGLKCFQALINVEVPKGCCITAKFNSDSLEKKDEDLSDFSYSFRVEYLPPIILTCSLPKSYPSNCAPYFTISVQWLNSAKISDLCLKLDSIWEENNGQEVIYQWLDWLHSSTLSYLGYENEIVLGPYGLTCDKDRRAISKSISPNIDIPFLKSYSDEQLHENFCRNIQECPICFSEFPGTQFVKLPCQHFFCWKCMKTFSDMHISEGTVMKLQCPESKCEGTVPPGLLKRLVGEQEFERWESLVLEKTLDSMSDIVYCPRCETPCIEDEDDHAQCSKCYYSFCTLCKERRHVGIACMTPEMKLVVLQERQKSTSTKGEENRRVKEMINDLLSLKEITSFAKQCPSCKMAISRTEGCNKMECGNCGQYFCFRCSKAIDGYEHFRDGNCELFPNEEIQRWEERVNGRQIVGQVQAQLFPNNGHPCPNCGQYNVKMGNNNHIFCWSCQSHYCYLCRKMVKRSSQHYGPKGCKQHTTG